MDANRWQHIKRVFQAVADVPEVERAAELDRRCGDDADLRTEVQSLLANHRTDEFIEPPSSRRVATAMENAESQSRVGRLVGPYRLARVLDAGGMGHVYLAERADGQFEKQVAVKVIRRTVDTPELRRRFQNEQRALAGLDHPNIAKLLDGGVTDDGLSYLVMEYVRGRPIDEHCEVKRLDLRQRLALFRTVCAAVHFAHQRLIVHRDLKPNNILVTDAGVPMLLDFGIAKLIGNDDVEQSETAPATMTFLTPHYASPEQIRAERITTSSDVYSLGVILYELLTGQKPYRARSGSQHELARLICEQEPVRPSTAARTIAARRRAETPRNSGKDIGVADGVSRLPRRLVGDIDNIILMAMRKEPNRRYGSVEQLSEDIRRYLVGLPIIARKDTFTYRAAKFVRRNRPGVIAAAIVLLSFVGGIIGTSIALVRVRDAKDKTQLMNDYLQRMLAEANVMESGRDLTLREVLDRAAARVEQDFASHPEIEASLRETIGNAYVSLRHHLEGLDQLEKSLALRRATFGEPSAEVARTLQFLGNALLVAGRFEAAEDASSRGIAMRRDVIGVDDAETATMLSDLAVIVKERGDYDRAEKLGREALVLSERHLAETDPVTATNLNNLAVLLKLQGRYDEADGYYGRAYDINRAAFGEDHFITVNALANLASLRHAQGRLRDAQSLYDKTLADYRRIAPADHPRLAIAANNYASLLMTLGDYDRAESLFRECLAINRKVFGAHHARTGTSMHNLARLLGIVGAFDEAERLCRDGLAIRLAALGPNHPLVATSRDGLGEILLALGKIEEAGVEAALALQIRQTLYPDEHAELAKSHETNAGIAIARGRSQAGLNHAESAVAMLTKLLGASHPTTIRARMTRANALIHTGQTDKALASLGQTEEGILGFATPDHPWLGTVAMLRGDACVIENRLTEAETHYRRAVDILERMHRPDHPDLRRLKTALSASNDDADVVGRTRQGRSTAAAEPD